MRSVFLLCSNYLNAHSYNIQCCCVGGHRLALLRRCVPCLARSLLQLVMGTGDHLLVVPRPSTRGAGTLPGPPRSVLGPRRSLLRRIFFRTACRGKLACPSWTGLGLRTRPLLCRPAPPMAGVRMPCMSCLSRISHCHLCIYPLLRFIFVCRYGSWF